MHPGAHGIFHIASPVSLSLQSYDDAITPAVNGTTSLLASALHHSGTRLKSVVITSSISALYSGRPAPGSIITEEGKSAIDLSTLRDDIATNRIPKAALYSISKVAADAAVWNWRDAHNPPFSVSSIYPSLVIGPPVQLPSSADALCLTLKPLWDIFSGAPSTLTPGMGGGLYVDVRDVAKMHYWAYAHPEIMNGEKFIASGGYGPAQAMADVLLEAYPEREGVIPKGSPGEGYVGFESGKVGRVEPPEGVVTVSGEKAERVMGIEWVDFRDSVRDTAKALEPLF
jgi:nucleoside-diphosphate-sugar epimerase